MLTAGCAVMDKTIKTTAEPIQVIVEESTMAPTLNLDAVFTVKPTKEPTDTPKPIEDYIKKSLYDSLPQPTPVYVPTEEDLAFKQQVISEGKIVAFDMSEWDLIDLMCNKLGLDEYLYRLLSYENHPNELYLRWTRAEPEGLHYTIYVLDTQNGDIFYRDEENKEYIISNIFTSEEKAEPFRLSEYNKDWLISQFIKNILQDELPHDVKVKVGYDGMHDMYFTTYKIDDGEIDYLEDYWVTEETGEVYSDFTGYVGMLFD